MGPKLAKAHGHHDEFDFRNAPAVLNAALQASQHWIGNREDVEDRATKSLVGAARFRNPDFDTPMAWIKSAADYFPMFQTVPTTQMLFSRGWGRAVGAYGRTLVTRW
jgi:hypothetical protein